MMTGFLFELSEESEEAEAGGETLTVLLVGRMDETVSVISLRAESAHIPGFSPLQILLCLPEGPAGGLRQPWLRQCQWGSLLSAVPNQTGELNGL